MQDNATTHTENFSVVGLEEVFRERLMRGMASQISRFEFIRLLLRRHWKNFVRKPHIRCKNWNIIFKEKLLIFPDKIFVLCREIFFYRAKPAQKMEVV